MKYVFALIGALIVFAGVAAYPMAIYGSTAEITATAIRDGERVCTSTDSGQSCRFLEYFGDETFQNVDSLLFMKWNSADVHREIVAGKTCNLKVVGWRVPFLSMFRNIISADCQ